MYAGGPPQPFAAGSAPTLRGELGGEAGGTPIVLCHGLTATRRSVVHGSRALERAGYRVISYDARGHGESDPAPPGKGYGYPELREDLEAVVAATVGEGPFVLCGHSMGAHTAVAYALANPARVAALVVIGPTYDGWEEPPDLGYWDGLAGALRAGGVDGFVDYIRNQQPVGIAWSDTVARFTRERMLRHRDPQALVAALGEVPRSRPFGSLEELAGLEMPALVVASGDEADPGHPRATALAYAERLPRARLTEEAEGRSPLAWQGGMLSREIAAFCAESLSSSP